VQPYLLVLFGQIWSLFAIFGPLGTIFGVGVRFKNFFGTYLCKKINFGFGSTALSFCINRSHFGPLFHFFGSFGAIFWPVGAFFGVGVRIKNIFQSLLMLTINFGFGSTPLSFCFEFSQIWGHFWIFWAFWGYFWGWGQVQNFFETYLNILTTFILEV